MLRCSFLSLSSSSFCTKYRLRVVILGKWNNGVPLRSVATTTTTFPSQLPHRLHHSTYSLLLLQSRNGIRSNLQLNCSSLRLLSSNTNHKSDQTESTNTSKDKDGGGKEQSSDSNEIVLTPGETVVAVSRLTMWAGIAVFAAVCAYYIAMELIPT